jgi:hypothetical protein
LYEISPYRASNPPESPFSKGGLFGLGLAGAHAVTRSAPPFEKGVEGFSPLQVHLPVPPGEVSLFYRQLL